LLISGREVREPLGSWPRYLAGIELAAREVLGSGQNYLEALADQAEIIRSEIFHIDSYILGRESENGKEKSVKFLYQGG